MKQLKDYKKQDTRQIRIITSIYIDKKQLEFLKKNRLNLSDIVRDLLNDLMRPFKKNDEK